MNHANRILGTLAALSAAMLVGCGGIRDAAERTKRSNDIKQVLLSYHSFLSDKKSPPADEKEFSAWVAAKQPEAAPALANLQAAGYKIYWGVDPMKLTAGSGNTVLIYPAEAPTKGGVIGMADGSARAMHADEFQGAAKPPAK